MMTEVCIHSSDSMLPARLNLAGALDDILYRMGLYVPTLGVRRIVRELGEAGFQLGVPAWRDIGTAPKDGTRIIGGTNDEEDAFVCAWDAHDGFGDGDWLAYGSDVVRPTKWIQMPA